MSRIETTILRNLLTNPEFTVIALPHLQTEYFEHTPDKIVFEIIKEHVEKYQTPPNREVLDIVLDQVEVAETDFPMTQTIIKNITDESEAPSDLKWITDTTEQWCKERSIVNAYYNTSKILDGTDKNHTLHSLPKIFEEAVNVSFQVDIGHDYVEDAEKRWDMYKKLDGKRVPFDIDILNLITKGGLLPKTLNVLLAPPNLGKTLWMCSIAAAALVAGKNVIYITLEMSTEQISKRIDANIFDIGLDAFDSLTEAEFMRYAKSIKNKSMGKLMVKEYPTVTASAANFKSYINECRMKKNGFKPDIVIIDYIGICNSSRLKNNGTTGSYAYVKAICEELRGLATECETAVLTAHQINREGSKSSDPSMADTADSFGLPMTVDLLLALITNEELDQEQKVMVKQLKSRYNDVSKNRRFLVGMHKSKQRLYNCAQEGTDHYTMTNEEIYRSSDGVTKAIEKELTKMNKGIGNRFSKAHNIQV